MALPTYEVSTGRKTMYYGGMGLSAIGVMLFMSNFCILGCELSEERESFHRGFNPMHDFGRQHRANEGAGFIFRAFGGIAMLGVGQLLMHIGRHGLAGSGVLLDPRQSRKDLEPLNRAAGGMVNDALEEVSVLKSPISEPTIKVRCRSCTALNDEAAKFCNQCGKPV